MMPSRLIEIEGRQHFLTQRFDRENGKKVHIQTLAAMNPLADSYEDLFSVCRQLRLPANEITEQYRRMVFNVLAGNVDDHTKNFSFMMREDGIWHVTPAYDLTFTIDLHAPAYVNRHSMTIGGKNDNITYTDLIEFARANDIKNAEAIISDVQNAIDHFTEFAYTAGLNDRWSTAILSHLNLQTP
jgi:serine/threonine-protein kinase HipA